jgi:hypothetical protein
VSKGLWRTTILAAVLSGCLRDQPGDRYERWIADPSNAGRASEYSSYLRERDVGDVLPLSQLLHSGRSWQRCNAGEFVVPPRASWHAMVRTLGLVRELQRRKLLASGRAASAYRTDAFNRCEGGSKLSRHRLNNAIDFDLAPDPARLQSLCDFWRTNGSRWRFGLGFYDDRRIHVDTSGFRTWGSDYTRRTSPCSTATR